MTRLHGVMAEFASPEALTAATREVRAAGYRQFDTYSPFPVHETAEAVGYNRWILPVIALVAAIVGAIIQYGVQYGLNVVDYPINVGGRPLHSWPAFVPATIIVAIMWSTAAVLIGMLVLNGLPRLSHPVFAVPGFERATDDRFFLCVEASDPRFDRAGVAALLARFDPLAVHEVPL